MNVCVCVCECVQFSFKHHDVCMLLLLLFICCCFWFQTNYGSKWVRWKHVQTNLVPNCLYVCMNFAYGFNESMYECMFMNVCMLLMNVVAYECMYELAYAYECVCAMCINNENMYKLCMCGGFMFKTVYINVCCVVLKLNVFMLV